MLVYIDGCETPAAVTVVAGSGLKSEDGVKVIDNNLRSKWVAKGKGESLWLGLATPTVIDSVAIAFRKVGGWRDFYRWCLMKLVKESPRHKDAARTVRGETEKKLLSTMSYLSASRHTR